MEGLLFLSGQYYGIMKKSCMNYKNSPFKTEALPFFSGFQNDMDNTVLLNSPEGRKSEGSDCKSSQVFSTVTRKT